MMEDKLISNIVEYHHQLMMKEFNNKSFVDSISKFYNLNDSFFNEINDYGLDIQLIGMNKTISGLDYSDYILAFRMIPKFSVLIEFENDKYGNKYVNAKDGTFIELRFEYTKEKFKKLFIDEKEQEN